MRLLKIVAICISLVPAQANAQSISMPLAELKEKPSEPRAEWNLFLELRDTRDQRQRNQNLNQQDVQEIAASIKYKLSKHMHFLFEASTERIYQSANIFIKQAYVNWAYENFGLDIQMGRMFLGVGVFNQLDTEFSRQVEFHNAVMGSLKGIDAGVEARVQPFGPLAYLQAGVFSGRTIRAEDEREGPPESNPRYLSLRSRSAFHEVYVSYFQHDLAFRDPMNATSFGFELKSPTNWLIRPRALFESWSYTEGQQAGPDEYNLAFGGYIGLNSKYASAGYRRTTRQPTIRTVQREFDLPRVESELYHLDVHPLPYLTIRGEKIRDQNNLNLRDELIVRGIVNIQL